jgi:hypothetical protein
MKTTDRFRVIPGPALMGDNLAVEKTRFFAPFFMAGVL